MESRKSFLMSVFLSACFLSYALWLRFHHLSVAPVGLDTDEAQILMEARMALSDGRFFVYGPSGLRWEMFAGYFYVLLERVMPSGWPLRAGPALIGVAELGLFGVLIRRLLEEIRKRPVPWTDVLLPVAALALSPWHLYYSRILGTCTGSAFWVLLLLLQTASAGIAPLVFLALSILGSLFWYTTLRIVAFFLCVESVLKKQWRRAVFIASALPTALIIIFFSSSSLAEFWTRGTGNLDKPNRNLLENYWGAFTTPFFGISERFSRFDDSYGADWVHLGFYQVSAGKALLSSSLSVVILLGSAWLIYRLMKKQHIPGTLRRSTALVALVFMTLGFLGPSSSRFLLIGPLLILPAVVLLEAVRAPFKYFLWFLVLVGMATESGALVNRLSDRNRLEPFFPGRISELVRRLPSELSESNPDRVIWVARETYVLAHEIQQRASGFRVLPAIDPNQFETILRSWSGGKEQFVIFDQQSPRTLAVRSLPDDGSISRIEKHIRYYSDVLEERQILSEDGQGPLARILKIRWMRPDCIEWCHP